MLFICSGLYAQKGTADSARSRKNVIQILDNEVGEYIQNDSNSVHKLKGNVKLLHGSDTLYCDSAYFYTKRNSVEAFGDVLIRQADLTEASADYMRYNGLTKVVYMRADNPLSEVQLYDGKENTLWSREIDYNLNTKIGRYKKRGLLQTATTVLESNTGEYNMRTKDARFRGDVVVTDPEYKAFSTDLGYNTETKVARFFGPSIVSNDKSILQTSNGVYDTKNRTSHFVDRSSILNEAQYIEGDTLDYDRNSGFGFAIGNVIAIDTGMQTTLYCGYVQYNEIHKTMLAYDKPLMKKADGKNSRYIRADTFFSAPDPSAGKVMTAQDSLQQTANEIRSSVVQDTLLQEDSAAAVGADTALTGSSDTTGLVPSADFMGPDSLAAAVQDTASLPVADDTAAGRTDSLSGQKNDREALKRKMDLLVYQKGNGEPQRPPAVPNDMLAPARRSGGRSGPDSALRNSYNNVPSGADTSGPRYFVGYHNVLIYSDSLQGKCDSIRYSQVDSTIRMFGRPVLWPRNSQLNGDVINLLTDSNKLREVYVPRNAIIVTRSGPEKADMFDQIQGNSIRAYLRDNKMDSLIAEPNASSIYFIKDEDSAYVGSSEAKSERIEVLFENEEIRKIIYRKDVEQKTTPMKDVIPSALRLSRFSWLEQERPKTLEEFLQGATLPHEPELLRMSDTEATGASPEEVTPATDSTGKQEEEKPRQQ